MEYWAGDVAYVCNPMSEGLSYCEVMERGRALGTPSSRSLPPEVQRLVSLCKSEMLASEVWLFGSRARGDYTAESDYDILALVPDDAPKDIDSPLATFRIRRASRANADLLTARESDFRETASVANTICYAVSHEGVRIDV